MPTCNHCLLEFPEREAVYDEIDGEKRVFCCHGCHGIYRLIHGEGLDEFYRKRQWNEKGISKTLFEKEIDVKPFAEHVRDIEDREQKTEVRIQKEIDIYIDDIRCASCVWLNEKILSKTEGIKYARVNYATHRARIRWDPNIIGLDRIIKRIISIGYNPRPYSESEQFKRQRAEAKDLLIRFGTAGFLSSQLMIYTTALYAGYFQGIDAKTKLIFEIIAMLLTIPVIFYSGMPFIRNTFKGLQHLNFNMDSLITIGSGSAFIYSIYQMFIGGKVYFDTSAMIITLILLGRYIETTAKGRASETIDRLSKLNPKEARLVMSQDSEVTEIVPVTSINKGDLIRVIPGERVPLDGIIVSGESEVDESIITGESKPIHKSVGYEVIGGSMNLYGTFVFKVTKKGKETVLSNIIKAVEDAQARKPQIQTIADRVVGIFVPTILIIAFFTVATYILKGASTQHALMAGISVVVIACPCSLGLATPLAVLIFTTMASSKGILIRGGEVIENTSQSDHVIFDKTGTITLGRPVLKEVIVFDTDLDREYILSLAASIERLSEHSIGHAITESAKGLDLFNVFAFKTLPGKGVEGIIGSKKIFIGSRELMYENNCFSDLTRSLIDASLQFEKSGDIVIYIGWDRRVRALFVISDVIRDEAVEVVNKLKKAKIRVSIVSGDNRITTNSIASMIGIDYAIAEASPIAKKELVTDMQSKGHKIIMVGDGINDAPALTEAMVGIAMGRGTDIAMESADAVLVRNDLRLILYFMNLSKKTFSIIKQNIFWAFFYNIIAIPLAVLGILHPIIAAGAMAASSLFVVGNSMRIKRAGRIQEV
ncbi:copper-translocating P-type ATPase [hot springs metagenome]|uniref:Copper-translocating P-type ATPase n=1 Tax=hot springs metagenome TaxID=433727 RepID=A0A5J4L2E4_9ZZZZ